MRSDLGWIVIEWSISIGNLLQIAAFLIAGVGAFFALRTDIKVLKHDMEKIQRDQVMIGEAMKQMTNVLTTLAVQQVRLDRAEMTIDEMRHGQGFVNPMRS